MKNRYPSLTSPTSPSIKEPTLPPEPPGRRCRRYFPPEFKEAVFAASEEPGRSVAGVTQQYSLNANLVHKWRRQRRGIDLPDFVQLPVPDSPVELPVVPAQPPSTVRMELPGGIVVHWP